MAKTINLFEIKDWENSIDEFNALAEKFTSQEFREFIGDKCLEALRDISDRELAGISEEDIAFSELEKYKSMHKVKIGKDYVLVFNDAEADLDHLNPITRQNYADGLSVALLVEYGMGIYGQASEEDDYQVKVNPSRDYTKEWHYRRDGNLYKSLGTNGRLIYLQLERVIEEKLDEWINEYLELEDIA